MKKTHHNELGKLRRYIATNKDNLHPAYQRLYGYPAGEVRRPMQGAWLKDELMKAGIPDLFLPYPVGKQAGLFVELKVGDDKLSARQKEISEYLVSVGYHFSVARSAEEIINIIKSYLED